MRPEALGLAGLLGRESDYGPLGPQLELGGRGAGAAELVLLEGTKIIRGAEAIFNLVVARVELRTVQ